MCSLEMPLRKYLGTTVLTWGRKSAIRRGGRYLPQRGEKRFFVAFATQWYYFRWRAHRGYVFCSRFTPPDQGGETIEQWSFGDEKMPIKKRAPSGELPVIPALSVDTTILKRCPLLVEFLSATAYEDGSIRQPGYITIRNRTIEYEATLYDPDAGMRVSIRARELDKMLAGVEAILGATEAPWEIDKYLWEHKPKEKKKKS